MHLYIYIFTYIYILFIFILQYKMIYFTNIKIIVKILNSKIIFKKNLKL